jgi:PBSX family phage terminase large subunit
VKVDGDLELQPFSPKAKLFLAANDKPIEILEGSIRSSKSITSVVKLIGLLADPELLKSDAQSIIAGKTIGSVIRNLINPMCRILNTMGVEYNLNRLDNKLEIFYEERTFIFNLMGFSTKESEEIIRGFTGRLALIDEMDTAPEDALFTALDRFSEPGARMIMTLNPQVPSHFVYKRIIDNERLKPFINYFHFTLDDTLTLTEDYKERVKSQYPPNSSMYRRKILGLRSAADTSVYGSYMDYYDTSLGSAINYDPEKLDFDSLVSECIDYSVGLDWGSGNVSIAPLVGLHPRYGFLVIDEWFFNQRDIESDSDSITVDRMLDGILGMVGRYSSISKLGHIKLETPHDASIVRNTIKATPRYNNRILPRMFKPDLFSAIEELQKLFYARDIKVHPRCRNLIDSLTSYSYLPDGEKVDKKSNDHGADSLRGPVISLNKFRLSKGGFGSGLASVGGVDGGGFSVDTGLGKILTPFNN